MSNDRYTPPGLSKHRAGRSFCLAGLRALVLLLVFAGAATTFAQDRARIPSFDLEALDGSRFSSTSLAGKVILVDFWATWCAPCIQEIPHLNDLQARYRTQGLVVVGVTVQSGWASDVKPDVERFGIRYPVVLGDQNVEKGFGGVWGLPTTFLVDRKGRIHRKYAGQDPQKHVHLEAEIQKLLADTR